MKRSERGATAVEYSLIAAFCVLALYGAVEALGLALDTFLTAQCADPATVGPTDDPTCIRR